MADPLSPVEEVFEELVGVLRKDLAQRNTTAPSFVIVLTPNGPKFSLIMDPAGMFSYIRQAVLASPGADAFICVHDGHVVDDSGPREALLLVRGTKMGDAVYGRAYPYERSVFGAKFDDSKIFEPKPLILNRFKGMFR